MLKLQLFVRDLMDKLMGEEGQTATEYALVLVLVAIALAVALGAGLNGEAGTVTSRNATVTLQYFQNGLASATCVVGGSVRVTASGLVTFAKVLKLTPGSITLNGKAEMRVERCP